MNDQFEPDFEYHFIWEACLGTKIYVHIDYYARGTNFIIHSASEEPNEEEAVEYSCYYASGEEVTETDLHPEESWVLEQIHQTLQSDLQDQADMIIDSTIH